MGSKSKRSNCRGGCREARRGGAREAGAFREGPVRTGGSGQGVAGGSAAWGRGTRGRGIPAAPFDLEAKRGRGLDDLVE